MACLPRRSEPRWAADGCRVRHTTQPDGLVDVWKDVVVQQAGTRQYVCPDGRNPAPSTMDALDVPPRPPRGTPISSTIPSGNHNGGAGIAFADGHAINHKWQDARTYTHAWAGPNPAWAVHHGAPGKPRQPGLLLSGADHVRPKIADSGQTPLACPDQMAVSTSSPSNRLSASRWSSLPPIPGSV